MKSMHRRMPKEELDTVCVLIWLKIIRGVKNVLVMLKGIRLHVD